MAFVGQQLVTKMPGPAAGKLLTGDVCCADLCSTTLPSDRQEAPAPTWQPLMLSRAFLRKHLRADATPKGNSRRVLWAFAADHRWVQMHGNALHVLEQVPDNMPIQVSGPCYSTCIASGSTTVLSYSKPQLLEAPAHLQQNAFAISATQDAQAMADVDRDCQLPATTDSQPPELTLCHCPAADKSVCNMLSALSHTKVV